MHVIPAFGNHLPVSVRFGEGTAATLPHVLGEIGAGRVLLLVDEGFDRLNPEAAAVLGSLSEDAGVSVARFDKRPLEPTVDMVDDAARALAVSGATALVALGGGSVLDTAKAARLCAQLGCTFRQFLAGAPAFPVPELPLVAVPTTAGTGSEVSGGSVVTDPEAGRKAGIANANLRAQYALVDPLLTRSMPASTTAHTGVDALAQAIAAVVARVRTPIGDAIALEAVRMMAPALVAAYRDGTDRAARSAMSCGSMMAGLAMNLSDCTAEHSLGQAIAGVRDVPHGLTVGLVLAETLERERTHVPGLLERVADAMGEPDDGSGDGSRAVRAVRRILADIDFPVLGSLGIGTADLDDLADAALRDHFITMSPEPWSKAEVVEALTGALATRSRSA